MDKLQVLVLRWNTDTEQFDNLNVQEPEEADRYRAGVLRFEFDATLGSYPFADDGMRLAWRGLTSHISPHVLFTLEPLGKLMRSHSKPLSAREQAQLQPASSETWPLSQDQDQGQSPIAATSTSTMTNTYYTPIPKYFPTEDGLGMDPAMRTKLHLDKTAMLEFLTRNRFQGDMAFILGEMQFAFLSFLLGQSFESFDQWKALVQLLCSCGTCCMSVHHAFVYSYF